MRITRLFLACSLLTSLAACGSKPAETAPADAALKADSAAKAAAEASAQAPDPRTRGGEKNPLQVQIEENEKKMRAQTHPVSGTWTGEFGKNKITLALAAFSGDSIWGHSICAGNFRPLRGTLTAAGKDSWNATLHEPGDDPYDGIFTLNIRPQENKLSGDWKPFASKKNAAKTFALNRREFVLDLTVGDYPESSGRLLTPSDVENMSAGDLEIMRNEIYARHGYCFKNKTMRYHFEAKSWYMPLGVDIREGLSDIEVQNIVLIQEYEDYANEYYDGYGR